jgi:hypothetical protein
VTVTTSENVWVCSVISAPPARMTIDDTGSHYQYSKVIIGGYTSPPSTLPGGFTQTANRDQATYFTIK